MDAISPQCHATLRLPDPPHYAGNGERDEIPECPDEEG